MEIWLQPGLPAKCRTAVATLRRGRRSTYTVAPLPRGRPDPGRARRGPRPPRASSRGTSPAPRRPSRGGHRPAPKDAASREAWLPPSAAPACDPAADHHRGRRHHVSWAATPTLAGATVDRSRGLTRRLESPRGVPAPGVLERLGQRRQRLPGRAGAGDRRPGRRLRGHPRRARPVGRAGDRRRSCTRWSSSPTRSPTSTPRGTRSRRSSGRPPARSSARCWPATSPSTSLDTDRAGVGRRRHGAALAPEQGGHPAGRQHLARAGHQHRRQRPRGRRGPRGGRGSRSSTRGWPPRSPACCSWPGWCCCSSSRRLVRRGWRRWKGRRTAAGGRGPVTDLTRPRRPRRGHRAGSASSGPAGRWSLGPCVLAGATPYVAWFRELGCPVLVVATARGAGPVPGRRRLRGGRWSRRRPPRRLTEELRTHDRLARRPARRGARGDRRLRPGAPRASGSRRRSSPPTSRSTGRPVTGGRPAAFLALEDKMLADEVWDAAGVARAPYRVVDVDDDAGARPRPPRELAAELGAVWAGDARDGFNGGGNFVRWVRDERRPGRGAGVLPAALRPGAGDAVPRRRAVLDPRLRAARRHRGAAAGRDRRSCATRPPGPSPTAASAPPGTRRPADREAMRDAVRRVGAHLQRAHGYRGAFGIDGVLTADGFRPTELNTRMSAGADDGLRGGPAVLHLPPGRAGRRRRHRAHRRRRRGAGRRRWTPTAPARWSCFGEGTPLGDGRVLPGRLGRHRVRPGRRRDRQRLSRSAPTPSGLFAKVDPCAAVVPGAGSRRSTPRWSAYVDATYGVGLRRAGARARRPGRA